MKSNKENFNLDKNNIPKHIALIMDGNGRWAKKRGLPRTMGHKVGADRIFDIVSASKEVGIEVITVFAFSTENWKRSKDEIDYIFKLLETMLKTNKKKIKDDNVRITHIGSLDRLKGEYDSLKRVIEDAIDTSKDNTGVTLNIAFNYGAYDEIVNAVKKVSEDVMENKVNINDIDENLFEGYLMTRNLPKIDLMIRTSGEKRLSNFLLWQLAYSELIFTNTYWPDFNKDELINCIYEYQSRDRRFGNVK